MTNRLPRAVTPKIGVINSRIWKSLALFDASGDNGFVNWVYETSWEMLSPFRNIFHTVSSGAWSIDFTALFGLVVYGLAGLLAVKLINKWSK